MDRRPRFLLVLFAFLTLFSLVLPSAQVRPVYSRGIVGLEQVLRRLQTTASLLHTGAHPDDEDSALIARVARGDHARVAYLSLNRGEGGQNIIGLELFDTLGVIRTEELLQARTLDGGEQFFTTAFDFGFTKTMEEAATKYGEERILGDMVRAIRVYRPLVLVSRFSGTPADGHGQHQLAGKLTPLAFRAAGDPARFPEQIKEGLRPWQVWKLYVGQSFRPTPGNEPTLRLPVGGYDALLGRTYFEIAMEGRSQHKSQEMGMIERRGPQTSGLRLVERVQRITSKLAAQPPREAAMASGAAAAAPPSAPAGAASAPSSSESSARAAGAAASGAAAGAGGEERGVFDGLDVTVPGLARLAGLPDGALREQLDAMQKSAADALKTIDVDAPARIVPTLADGLKAARAARAALTSLSGASDEARADADVLLARKEDEFEEALIRAAGLTVDVLADRETAAPGESVRVSVQSYVPEGSPVVLGVATPRVPAGWDVGAATGEASDSGDPFARFFREVPTRAEAFSVKVAKDAPFTTPYWLRSPRKGYVFDWSQVDPASRNLPFGAPVASVDVAMQIGGVAVTLTRPVEYRYADSIRGEIRRPFAVVPAITVAFDSLLEVVPLAELGKPHRIAVRLQNQTLRDPQGFVRLTLPSGWTSQPAQAPFTLKARGDRTAVFFTVTPAAGTPAGAYQLAADAVTTGQDPQSQQIYRTAMRSVDYPHIQTHRLYDPAVAAVRVLDVKVAPVRVGYVMGSGDQVPDAIRRMGLDVTLLNADQLSAGDLSRFDTIVVGVRASESRPEFVSNNGRLLQFARDGGTLIVQYQQTDYVARGLSPLPGEMPTRVTDEAAPITVLQPTHPRFTFPNRITEDDWKDWVQERNLYAFSTFDPQYVPLLETRDPGEPAQRGGELYLRLGKGHYIYTAYAWFRQLPAGVPGAYRLFANLLSLPKAPAAGASSTAPAPARQR